MLMFVYISVLCFCILVYCFTGFFIVCNVIYILIVCKIINIVYVKFYYKKFFLVFCFYLWLRIYLICKILIFLFNKNWDFEDFLFLYLESFWSNLIEWFFYF